MKLLFSTALFFSVMATGSSIEQQAAAGADAQLTLEEKAMLMDYYYNYDMEAIDKDFAAKKKAFKKKKSNNNKKKKNNNKKKNEFKFKDDKKDKKDRRDDDDDDRRLFFDIDDDDFDRNDRSVIVPECIIGGTNYLRCDRDTMAAQDEGVCDLIDDLVCDRRGGNSNVPDEEIYCACIGLDSNEEMLDLFEEYLANGKEDDGGDKEMKAKDDKGGDKKAVDKSDARKAFEQKKKEFEQKKKEFKQKTGKDVDKDKADKADKEDKDDKDIDEKKKELDRKKKEFEKKKKEFKKDKKDDDDDDDDDRRRSIILPQCVVGGTNYQRCNPRTVRSIDERTCDDIDEYVCDRRGDNRRNNRRNRNRIEEEFCECIGLDFRNEVNTASGLRGAVSAF